MTKNSVVLYKNSAAVVIDRDGDKYLIRFCTQPATPTGKKAVYGEQKVREKDVILLHEGPCSSLEKVLAYEDSSFTNQLMETYELLQSDESTANEPISLNDFAEYARGGLKADEAWFVYSSLVADPHFALSVEELKNGNLIFAMRTQTEIDAINQKNYEKER